MATVEVDREELEKRKHKIIMSLKTTPSDILQQLTTGQSDNERWKEERLNRLTASNFRKVCKQKSLLTVSQLSRAFCIQILKLIFAQVRVKLMKKTLFSSLNLNQMSQFNHVVYLLILNFHI